MRPEKPRDYARLTLLVLAFVVRAGAWFAASFAAILALGW